MGKESTSTQMENTTKVILWMALPTAKEKSSIKRAELSLKVHMSKAKPMETTVQYTEKKVSSM